MIKIDVHAHTNFCDGKNTPEEMIVSAIEKGFDVMGLVVHSYTFFDTSYCVKRENIKVFQGEMARLKEKYKDKIKVLCGVEQDIFSTCPTDGFDYIIGSMHYFNKGNKYFAVDNSLEEFNCAVKEFFGGDYYLAAKYYFDTVSNIVERTNADIIGHFDLVSKYNERAKLFDENDIRYVEAYKKAVDKLVNKGVYFEINTGAIARKHRSYPYPDEKIIKYIKDKGGKFIVNSDSHSSENIGFDFDNWAKYVDKGENYGRLVK